jgi:hypothetical protein
MRAPRFWQREIENSFSTPRARRAKKNFYANARPQTQCIPQIARIFVTSSTSFPAAPQKPL